MERGEFEVLRRDLTLLVVLMVKTLWVVFFKALTYRDKCWHVKFLKLSVNYLLNALIF